MNPPRPFKVNPKRGYSLCMGCCSWKKANNIFLHEGRHWILCRADYEDYWYNTDVLENDYVGYAV